MDANIYDGVKEATATTGNGLTLTLTQIAGFVRFSDVAIVGELVYYFIPNGTNFEFGIGTVQASNTLDRTTPLITLVAGVYDDTTPVKITLVGSSTVSVAPSAVALLDGLNDASGGGAWDVLIDSQDLSATSGITIPLNVYGDSGYTQFDVIFQVKVPSTTVFSMSAPAGFYGQVIDTPGLGFVSFYDSVPVLLANGFNGAIRTSFGAGADTFNCRFSINSLQNGTSNFDSALIKGEVLTLRQRKRSFFKINFGQNSVNDTLTLSFDKTLTSGNITVLGRKP